MANVLTYENYTGSVEYSHEDRCFFGKIEFINDLITFEATTVDELEANFKEAVESYILTCKALNRKPQKQFNGVFNVRPGVELHMAAARKAMEMGVSLNAYIKSRLTCIKRFAFCKMLFCKYSYRKEMNGCFHKLR